MLYVAVDIGCIECGEESAVLGVFEDENAADAVITEHFERQRENWHGQHHFSVFKIDEINVENRVDYI
jgi:hypothetical protein